MEIQQRDHVIPSSSSGNASKARENEPRQPLELTPVDQALLTLEENSFPTRPLCREEESKQIETFVIQGIEARGCSKTLYIAGTPGIGKTLTVTSVIEGLKRIGSRYRKRFKSYYINALNFTSPKKIYKALLHKLFKVKRVARSNQASRLDYLLTTQENQTVRVIVIDELDYLMTKDQSVLYNLFEWTQHQNSKLILITIANTFDLPESLQTRIISRMGIHRIFFKGYNRDQVYQILEDRLKRSDIVSKQALKYACAKIVNLSCDIRRALFLLRGALQQLQMQPQTVNSRVEIDHVQRAFNEKIRYRPQCSYMRTMPRAYKIVLIHVALLLQDTCKCNLHAVAEKVVNIHNDISSELVTSAIIDLKDVRILDLKYKTVDHILNGVIEMNVSALDIRSSIEDVDLQELLEKVKM